ncbi:MAG: uracil-DNA glycosylase [Nitrospiraceae bacterium]|nr:uracil-DNA glycosylase [Nitrospiraceae bacterium]
MLALFGEKLFPVPSTPVLFNQYKDIDPGFDLPNAAQIRRENLRGYLLSFGSRPEILLVGEAAGPRGCRFSGIPFTSERQLERGLLPFPGRRSSLGETAAYSEVSGTIVWGALLPWFPRFFLWNAVPLHPHRAGEGNSLSIRTPSRVEIMEFSGMLREISAIIRPSLTVAAGRKAEHALGLIGVECRYVRHPAQSGAEEFKAGIKEALGGVLAPSSP